MRPIHILAAALGLGSGLAASACGDQVPSSFAGLVDGGAGEGGGRPGDGAAGDSPSLVGDTGPGSFQCGQTACHAGYYCVRVLSEGGVEESSSCYPLLQCDDCPCLTNVVATNYCAGDTLGCSGAPGGPLYVTCEAYAPGALPGDAGGG
jgi:hypothetical protein